MQTTNTIETAITGRAIKLSSAECLVLANLVNSLTRDITEYSHKTHISVKRDDLINLSIVMAKITSQDILSLEDVKKELFSPGEEMLVEEDRYDDITTSSVEAKSDELDVNDINDLMTNS